MITKLKQTNESSVKEIINSVFTDLYPISYIDLSEQYDYNTIELELDDQDYNDIERDLEVLDLILSILYPEVRVKIILNQMINYDHRVKSVIVFGDKR
jgi:hypothetical protein